MQRKLWKWIFSIFIVIVLVGLSTFLVLRNKNEDEDQNNDPLEEIYATAYTFNIPDTINILVGSKVLLKEGYLTITPANILKDVTHEITSKNNGNILGIRFNGTILEAIEEGNYTIKFKIPKSSTTYFTKNINIVVYNNQLNSHVQQSSNSIIINETLNLDYLFVVRENLNHTIETDSRILYSNKSIKALSVGLSTIKFTFAEDFVLYEYTFQILVKEEPLYKILVNNATNNIIEIDTSVDDVFFMEVYIVDKNLQHIDQRVNAVSNNENIITIVEYTEPFIKIKAMGVGETIIHLSYTLDETIKFEVKVIVK